MQITRFGQSALLVQEGATRVVVDPGELSGEAVFALEELSGVVFTHEHPDHCAPGRLAGLLSKSPEAEVFGPRAVLDRLTLSEDVKVHLISDSDDLRLGALRIGVHGGDHQLIHASVPRTENLGLVFTDGSGLRLFHPGDSYEVVPARIDVLALPVVGPWGSLREAVAFAEAVAPRRMFPIHDAHLSESGRALFWPWIQRFASGGIEAFDPEPGTAVSLGRD